MNNKETQENEENERYPGEEYKDEEEKEKLFEFWVIIYI